MSIEHADFEGVERLALVLGGEIASTFDNPKAVKLGHCDLIEEVVIGESKVIRFSGVASGEACTIVLRGASSHILEEADRSLHDALCILQQTIKVCLVFYLELAGVGKLALKNGGGVGTLAQRGGQRYEEMCRATGQKSPPTNSNIITQPP